MDNIVDLCTVFTVLGVIDTVTFAAVPLWNLPQNIKSFQKKISKLLNKSIDEIIICLNFPCV